MPRLPSLSQDWGPTAQSNTAVIRDIFRQYPCRGLYRGAVISLPQQWNHGTSRIACARIIDHRLQTISDFNAVVVLVRRNQQQHAAIVSFAADAELLVQIHCEIFDALSFQGVHRNDRDLRPCLFPHLVAKRFQASLRVCCDHTRKVGYISGRANVFRIFRRRRKRRH